MPHLKKQLSQIRFHTEQTTVALYAIKQLRVQADIELSLSSI